MPPFDAHTNEAYAPPRGLSRGQFVLTPTLVLDYIGENDYFGFAFYCSFTNDGAHRATASKSSTDQMHKTIAVHLQPPVRTASPFRISIPPSLSLQTFAVFIGSSFRFPQPRDTAGTPPAAYHNNFIVRNPSRRTYDRLESFPRQSNVNPLCAGLVRIDGVSPVGS